MDMGKALSLARAHGRKGLQDQLLFSLAVGLTLPIYTVGGKARWP